MAISPDLRRYVDLTVHDRDPSDLVAIALQEAATRMPAWVPREGNTELVLIEAMALAVAELVYAINRTPGAVVEVLLRLFGIERSEGSPPEADVTFTLADALGHEVPIGSRVRLELGGSAEPLILTLTEGVVVAAGQTTGTAPAVGNRNTSEANGIAAGTGVDVIEALAFVESAALGSVVTAGTDPETDLDWLDRGIERTSRLVETLVLPKHFTSAALENPLVHRATTIDNWNVTAAANGHVTVAVAGVGGVALTAGTKTDLETVLEAAALANLDVHVIDPTVTVVNVTVTVKKLADAADADVVDAVEAVLDAYLDPDAWPWSGTVRRNELIALVDGAAGVDYVVAVTAPAADVNLGGVAPLADLGTVVVTVT